MPPASGLPSATTITTVTTVTTAAAAATDPTESRDGADDAVPQPRPPHLRPLHPRPPRPEREDERLSALRRYRILDTGTDVDFDDVTALAASLTGSPVALVTLVDEGRAWFKARAGLDVEQAPRDVAFCSWVVADPRQPLRVPDLAADGRFATNPLVQAPGGFGAYAGVPLMSSDGHALGTVCVLDHQRRDWSDEHVAGLQRLARSVMSHIEARRVTHALLSVTDVLDEVRQLQHAPDLDTLSSIATRLLAHVVDADSGELRLPNVNAAEPRPQDELHPQPCQEAEGHAERASQRAAPGETGAVAGTGLHLSTRRGRVPQGPVTVLELPLVRDGVLLGTLTASWPYLVTGLDPTVERVLEVLAHQTGYALHALQERQHLQLAAETDALTGLANRRAGENQLRQWPHASIALIDLDHFKQVNDTHGHAAGDTVLRQVAVALARHSRSADLVCRWGGEEFLLALPDADLDVLDQLLARVRSDLATQTSTTFSAGLATRSPGEPVRDVLARADSALYNAKHHGRAATAVAGPASDSRSALQPVSPDVVPVRQPIRQRDQVRQDA